MKCELCGEVLISDPEYKNELCHDLESECDLACLGTLTAGQAEAINAAIRQVREEERKPEPFPCRSCQNNPCDEETFYRGNSQSVCRKKGGA